MAAATRAELESRVLSNTASKSRYGQQVIAALNEAVQEICRMRFLGERWITFRPSAPGRVTPLITQLQVAQGEDGVETRSKFQAAFRVLEIWTVKTQVPTGQLTDLVVAGQQVTGKGRRLQPADEARTDFLPDRGPSRYYGLVDTTFADESVIGVVLYPDTDAQQVYACRGLFYPRPMSSETQRTGIGAVYDSAVVAYAKARVFENEDDFDMAAQWTARFQSAVLEASQVRDGQGFRRQPGMFDGM